VGRPRRLHFSRKASRVYESKSGDPEEDVLGYRKNVDVGARRSTRSARVIPRDAGGTDVAAGPAESTGSSRTGLVLVTVIGSEDDGRVVGAGPMVMSKQ